MSKDSFPLLLKEAEKVSLFSTLSLFLSPPSKGREHELSLLPAATPEEFVILKRFARDIVEREKEREQQ